MPAAARRLDLATLNGSYKGSNVYSTTPSNSQTATQQRGPWHDLQVLRSGPERLVWADELRFDATESGSATMSVSYWVDGIDQTSAIVAGTFVTDSLAPGAFKVIEVRVTVASNAGGNAKKTVRMTQLG